VATAAAGGQQGLGLPVLIHLSLGNSFHESLSILPMDMDVGDDLILGWDWISSHDLQHLYRAGHVDLRSGQEQLQLALLPASARPAPATLSTVIGHGELRRLLRQIVCPDTPAGTVVPAGAPATASETGCARSKGWSRPRPAQSINSQPSNLKHVSPWPTDQKDRPRRCFVLCIRIVF
jgi:hypothetical protein